MRNSMTSLSLLFNNAIFRIPDYQRGYAWDNSQLNDFWDDLYNLTEDRYHYTGMLSLKELSIKDCYKWEEDKWILENGYCVDGVHYVRYKRSAGRSSFRARREINSI